MNHKSQAILLTSYAKFMNLYPDTKPAIEEVLQKLSTSPVLELQQRACEYLMLTKLAPEVMENVLNSMPAYSDNKVLCCIHSANAFASLLSLLPVGVSSGDSRQQTREGE